MKYAVVTGSSSGIGLAIARKLINEGYFVFINGRNDCVPDLAEGKYMFINADVSSMNGMEKLVSSVLCKTDKIDCLVLNAGTTCRKKMSEITFEDWIYVMNTNVNIPFFIVQKFFPHINKDGNILFIGSAMGLKPHATSLPYGVSKTAVNALAQGLVKETAPRKIRVNSLCPGFVDTEWQREKPQWLREKIISKTALKRFATPEEIADMCVKIIDNSYINGAVVSIDGGYDME